MTDDSKPPPEAVTIDQPVVQHTFACHKVLCKGECRDEPKRAVVAEWPTNGLPYPWCHQPAVCRGRSCCPRDPNCGE